jgi:hypothetical protein
MNEIQPGDERGEIDHGCLQSRQTSRLTNTLITAGAPESF